MKKVKHATDFVNKIIYSTTATSDEFKKWADDLEDLFGKTDLEQSYSMGYLLSLKMSPKEKLEFAQFHKIETFEITKYLNEQYADYVNKSPLLQES